MLKLTKVKIKWLQKNILTKAITTLVFCYDNINYILIQEQDF